MTSHHDLRPQLAAKLGPPCLQAPSIRVEDFPKIMAYGVMSTPALAIDGKLVVSGKAPSKAQVTALVTTALASQG